MKQHHSEPDADWIQSVVRDHETALLRYTIRLMGDVERARDVVQDAFLRLVREDRAAVENRVAQWLYTVCRNRAFDIRKKESRMKTASQDMTLDRAEDCESPSTALENKELQLVAVGFLDTLPERQNEAIRMRIDGGLSYRQIAEVLETSPSNVGVLIHKGICTIRKRMAKQLAFDEHTKE